MEHSEAHNIILTEGNILSGLARFSAPILAGQLLQTLYNSVDSIVVGRCVGTSALAAVTASTPITQFFVGFFMGMSIGASVLLARSFGGEEFSALKRGIHTAVTFSLALGTAVAALGAVFAPVLLSAVACPADVHGEALIYLRIYMAGALCMTMYNMGSAVLRSVGDSRSPFIYLVVSSFLNIVLDILFVAVLGMGVEGVAIATVIAQFTSVVLTFRRMMSADTRYRFSFRETGLDGCLLKEIVSLGLPAGVQAGVISLSAIFLQRYINSFSSAAIAGIGAAMRIDSFAGMPCIAIGLAMTTYIGQNIGAKRYDRARKGICISLAAVAVMVTAVGIPAYFFAAQLLGIFSADQEVVYYGVRMLHTIMPVYFFMGFNQLIGGVIRGYGHSLAAMLGTLSGIVAARQIWLAVTLYISHDIQWIYWGYPFGWVVAALIMTIFYLRVIRRRYA